MGATRNTENTTRNANANANMITSKTFRHQFEDSATLSVTTAELRPAKGKHSMYPYHKKVYQLLICKQPSNFKF